MKLFELVPAPEEHPHACIVCRTMGAAAGPYVKSTTPTPIEGRIGHAFICRTCVSRVAELWRFALLEDLETARSERDQAVAVADELRVELVDVEVVRARVEELEAELASMRANARIAEGDLVAARKGALSDRKVQEMTDEVLAGFTAQLNKTKSRPVAA